MVAGGYAAGTQRATVSNWPLMTARRDRQVYLTYQAIRINKKRVILIVLTKITRTA